MAIINLPQGTSMQFCIDCLNIRVPVGTQTTDEILATARCAKDDLAAGIINPITSKEVVRRQRQFCTTIRDSQKDGSCAWYAADPVSPTPWRVIADAERARERDGGL